METPNYTRSMPSSDILIEIRRIGTALRVAAIDSATGTEVVFQAPGSLSEAAIRKLAADKLSYVLKQKQRG